MSKNKITIEGIKPFRRKLKKLPEKIQRSVAKKAVRAAAAEVRKTAQKLVKQNRLGDGLTPAGATREHLYKAITTVVRTYGRDKIPVGVIGDEEGRAPHANIIHPGAKPHAIGIPKDDPVLIVQHPGIRGYPYMTIALDQSRGRAQKAMIDKLSQAIAAALQKQKGAK